MHSRSHPMNQDSPHTSHPRRKTRHGFTLLEIMLAVAVLGLVAISIYRFVDSTLSAVRISAEKFQDDELIASFTRYLRAQILDLPVRLGAITGEPHRFDDIPCDELRWIASSGSGLLTRFGRGEYTVTLTAQQIKGKNGEFELGLRRQDIDGQEDLTWLPLFQGVKGFEVRYYDTRSQEWLDRWADLTARPTLVKVRLWRDPSPDPYELTLSIPYASASAQMPNANPAARGGRGRTGRGRTDANGNGNGPGREGRPGGEGQNRRDGQPGNPNSPGAPRNRPSNFPPRTAR